MLEKISTEKDEIEPGKGLDFVEMKLNDPAKRDSRGVILSAYATYLHNKGLKSEFTYANFNKHAIIDLAQQDFLIKAYPTLEKDMQTIKSDFEAIAVMEKYGKLDEKAYFDFYFGSMLKCYAALHGHIKQSRKKAKTSFFTVYYPRQCKRAIRYWQKEHPKEKINYYVGIQPSKSSPVDNKQLDNTAMTKMFELLSKPELKAAKRKIAREYWALKDAGKKAIFDRNSELRSDADRLKTAFNQACALVLHGSPNKEYFFRLYGGNVVRTWALLEDDIARDLEKNPAFCTYFKEIKEKFEPRILPAMRKPYRPD